MVGDPKVGRGVSLLFYDDDHGLFGAMCVVEGDILSSTVVFDCSFGPGRGGLQAFASPEGAIRTGGGCDPTM